MLKNNYFFILVLLLCSFIACEDDKKESEESCPQPEVTGGEVAGGVSTTDMGLEGGQSFTMANAVGTAAYMSPLSAPGRWWSAK